jgi:Domain of unknown function (DUF4232)
VRLKRSWLPAVLVVAVALAVSAGAGSRKAGATTTPNAAANRARAQAEAARLLGFVALPAGAQPSTSDPATGEAGLAQPTYDEATPNLVDAHAWWTSAASPQAVLAFVAAHRPAGATMLVWSGGSGTGGTHQSVSEAWALPPVRGVLSERALGVTAVALSHGVTGVRTDGEAVWLTPRPAWERIPPGVRRVVFTARGAGVDGRPGPVSVPRTLTGARARRLVAFINAEEVVQPGVRACPAAFDESVSLTFIAAGGETLARATESPTGCASVALTIGGRSGPPLEDDPGVTDELVRLGAVPVCAGGELSASATPPGRNGPVSARVVWFNFQNRSRLMCRLAGFPRLTAFDAAGRRVPIAATDLGAAIVAHQGLAATSVLDPGQAAGFAASYSRCPGAPAAVAAEVMLPGVARRFRLAMGTAREPFAPCHGQVGLGNL